MPSHEVYTDPNQLQMRNLIWEEREFLSLDGTKLNSWFLKTKEKVVKGTIILFHGNAQNLSSHFLSLAWIVPHGYDVFVFDYRGYGKSEGSPYRSGIYLDALAALNEAYHLKEERGAKKFIVYGQSLGGIVSVRAIFDFPQYDKIDLVVCESSFPSYQEIAFDRIKQSSLFFWLSPLAYILVTENNSIKNYLPKISRPLLVIHGTYDMVIPVKFGEEIYRLAGSQQKWIWTVPGGEHIDAFWHFSDGRYQIKFLRFLDQVLVKVDLGCSNRHTIGRRGKI